MKIWQKVYLAALAVFLIMLNTGLFLAAGFIFQHNLTAEQEQAKTECHFLSQNLEHDFSILEKTGRFEDEIIDTLVQGYQNYYAERDSQISLKKSGTDRRDYIETSFSRESRMTVRLEQALAEPYGEYVLTYQKELSAFEALWRSVRWMFAGISLLMSLLLSPLLYLLLKALFRPLQDLSDGVARIAEGDYGCRIECRGKDEIAALAGHVNHMSEEIARQMTALREESGKKQQLMDNMAHELRTPLTSIYGYAEYLLRAKASEEERYDGLSYIMSESTRLLKMGELMLSMRLYQRTDTEITSVDISDLTGHVRKLLGKKLKEQEVTLCCEMPEASVAGEEELLVNLFRNLLENAVRASRPGQTVRWKGYVRENGDDTGAAALAKAAGNRTIVFTVEDEGVGMNEEELSRITEPFYRVDRARSRAQGGAGLGLSVADVIVKRYGGSMSFASESGRGTRVTVELPGAQRS